MTKLNSSLQSPSFVQLSLTLNRKPFLQIKKKVRGRSSRAAFDNIEKQAHFLKFKLEIGAIQSFEARVAIKQFLELLGLSSQNPSLIRLSSSLNREPFLQVRKKIRDKDSRAAFDNIEKQARFLRFKLETGAIQSPEARDAIKQFLEELGLI